MRARATTRSIKDRFRPGHADYTYQQKYGLRDYRGGGRSSARETVMRVAAGAIARKYLAERLGVRIYRLSEPDRPADAGAGESGRGLRESVLLPGSRAHRRNSRRCMWEMRGAGDSIGARITVIAQRRAAGPGRAGVRPAGCGYRARHDGHQRGQGGGDRRRHGGRRQRGSEHRDELTPSGFRSNHAGGMLGGISSGQDIVAHVDVQADLEHPGSRADHRSRRARPVEVVTTGRHDPCVGLRATPIAEAMLAIVLHGPLPAPSRRRTRT